MESEPPPHPWQLSISPVFLESTNTFVASLEKVIIGIIFGPAVTQADCLFDLKLPAI